MIVLSDAEKPQRRWLRFSLRTLFLVVTCIGVWWGWNVYVVRERQALRQWLEDELNGQVMTGVESIEYHRLLVGEGKFVPPTIPVWRRWLGDEPIDQIHIPKSAYNEANLARLERWFPEAVIPRPPEPINEIR